MQIDPIQPYINKINTTVKKHPNATKATAAGLIASTSVLVATKAPKGVVNQIRPAQRLKRAGLAGGIMLAAVALLNINKEKTVQAVSKVKEIFKRNPAEKELDKIQPECENTEPNRNNIEENTDNANPFVSNTNETIPTEEDKNSDNPFSQNNLNSASNFLLNKNLGITPTLQKPNMIGGLNSVQANPFATTGMVSPLG